MHRSKDINKNTQIESSDLEKDLQELKTIYKSRARKITNLFKINSLFSQESETKANILIRKIQVRLENSLFEIQHLVNQIKAKETYLIYSKKSESLSKINKLEQDIDLCEKNYYPCTELVKKFKADLANLKLFVLNYNEEFVKQRKNVYKHLWQKGSISLDDEQQTAIVTDDKHNLVVAAAGSGKTEVLITRIAYLIKRKPDSVQPNRILAIAYQRKAKNQIEQRLSNRYQINDVNVKTFHKLGKDILEESGRKIDRTDIVDDNKKFAFLKGYFEQEVATNPYFYKLFIRYLKTINDKEEATREERNAVVMHAKERQYISIDGVKVKSKAEKEIMDFLLTHKINGNIITVKYEEDTDGFRPDFYLPQFDLVIEHWGINKDGEVPEWFSQSSQEYRDTMDKKEKWFAEHNKLLVETFAYEFNPNDRESFEKLLEERIVKVFQIMFPDKKLEFSPLNYEELLLLVWDSQKSPIGDLQNFITIAKTYGLTPEKVRKKMADGKWSTKQLSFGQLALNVFEAYEEALKKYNKTDFEDMINEAVAALDRNESLFKNVYDHILIDEYQDISYQRLNLLKKLLERNPNCKLFCVGDDWQSIMGFSGANLDFFVNFVNYFDNPAITKICTNYRSIKTIVDAGASIIKHNDNCQIQKASLSKRKEINQISVISSSYKGVDRSYCEQTVEDCLKRINVYIEKGYAPNDILVLTRYMRTKILGRIKFFQIVDTFKEFAEFRGIRVAVDNANEFNAIKLLTVHKCKGLEAKVVFVLDVVRGEFGFPSEIEDPSILKLAMGNNGIQDRIEEERRLFYVAVTRAKEDLYIYTRTNQESIFLDEISKYTKPVLL